jgi:hypothetical protein
MPAALDNLGRLIAEADQAAAAAAITTPVADLVGE